MSQSKIRLGINIDHIATIKTNRKTPYPSLIDAKIAEESGRPNYSAFKRR